MQSKTDNRFKTLKDFYCNKIVIDLTELDLTKIENVNIVNYLRNNVKNPDSEPFYLVSEDKELFFSENYDSNKILIKFNDWIKMFPNFIKDENSQKNKFELFLKGYVSIHIKDVSEWNELIIKINKYNIFYKKPVIYNNYFYVKNNKLVSSFYNILPEIALNDIIN